MIHTSVVTKLPRRVPETGTPDGAITGNGAIGLVIGGTPAAQRIYISKADFWKACKGNNADGGIRLIGTLDISIPSLKGSDYRAEQRMDTGEVCVF